MSTEIRTGFDICYSPAVLGPEPVPLRCGVCVAVAFPLGGMLDEAAAREAFENAIRELKQIERLGKKGNIQALMAERAKRHRVWPAPLNEWM